METRAEELKKLYNLTQHPEGGSFAEVYTSSFVTADRAYMGSIYFLLDKDEISHFIRSTVMRSGIITKAAE